MRSLSPMASYFVWSKVGSSGWAREFWRSGGATGKPLFYPRSAEDMRYMLGVSFRRIWPCIGAGAGDVVHVAFPMGIHPVGQVFSRCAGSR